MRKSAIPASGGSCVVPLALGRVFGALALEVITSRAVIEPQQQIGRLRVGFTRRSV